MSTMAERRGKVTKPPTVAAFVETRYLRALAHRDPEKHAAREAVLRRHVVPAIGERPLREVAARDLKELCRAKLAARVPLATVVAIGDELGTLFRAARKARLYWGPLPLHFLPTVRGLVWRYLAELDRLGLDRASREAVLRRHVVPAFRGRYLAEISPADLRELVLAKAAAGVPPRTVAALGRALVGLFDYAREAHLYHGVVPTAFLLDPPLPRGDVGHVAAIAGSRGGEGYRSAGL